MILKSDAYQDLSPKAKALLTEMVWQEYPNRNGNLVYSVSTAQNRLGLSNVTARKPFYELQEKRLIEKNHEAEFGIGIATRWRITFLPCNGREATHEWREWKKQKSRVKK